MPMTNTWDRAEEIFSQSLELPEESREAFVHQACGEDEYLRANVMSLLAAGSRMSDFLESPALDFRGELFGAYRAGEEIGRGGMSVVYSGHRQDADFARQVAIKILLTQSGGAPETKILAALEHPHIARLFAAGVTAIGLRYLVVEYVAGVPCTQYAPARTPEQKIRLFLDLCAGVQAAHQALIVHRDLKPANILISTEGQLKILDFGIAKMLTPTLQQTTGPRAYTIPYASPEQVAGLPASTANDVYSLGVILGEWLSGAAPQPGLIPAALGADLRRIIEKATAADPRQRYESVAALAEDLRRYLSGEAVLAQPPTLAYQMSKFFGRYSWEASLGLAALVGILGTGVYAAREAQLANARFTQVRSFSRAVIFDLLDAVQPISGSQKTQEAIATKAMSYLDVIARNAGSDNEALLEAARGYLRLAAVPWSQRTQAIACRTRAIDLGSQILARSPGHPEAQRLLDAARSDAAIPR